MKLTFGKRIINVDEKKTREYYLSHPVGDNTDPVAREFDRYMSMMLDREGVEFARSLGVEHFGELRYGSRFTRPESGEVTLQGAAFPVFATVETVSDDVDADVNYPMPIRHMIGMAQFQKAGNFQINYQPSWMSWATDWKPRDAPEGMILINHVSPFPSFKPVKALPEVPYYSLTDKEQLEMMLHINANTWSELPGERWEKVKREFLATYVRPKYRAKATNRVFHDDMNGDGIQYASLLWDAFSEEYVPVFREGEPADKLLDSQSSDRYIIYVESDDMGVYLVEGALVTSEQLSRFRYVDIYVCPESLDWIYARTHEQGFGPYWVARD